jgi:hypothetical protein
MNLKGIIQLLLPLFLAACETPQQKVQQYYASSNEKAVMGIFANICISTAAIPEKMEEKLQSGRKLGLVVEMDSSKRTELQRDMRLYDDNIIKAWQMADPFKGINFNIYVTEKHTCVFDFENVDKTNMINEFQEMRNGFAKLTEVKTVRLDNRKFQGEGSTGYNFLVQDFPLRAQVSLVTPNDKYNSYQLIVAPIVSSFIKIKK